MQTFLVKPEISIVQPEGYIGLAESVPGGDAVWVMRSRSESMVQEKQVK